MKKIRDGRQREIGGGLSVNASDHIPFLNPRIRPWRAGLHLDHFKSSQIRTTRDD